MSSTFEVLTQFPDAKLHLIDKQQSIELARGVLTIILQNDIVIARVGEIQWPLRKDEAAVKLNGSHYLFTLKGEEGEKLLNYGLTIGEENWSRELDDILEKYSGFSVEEVSGDVNWEELVMERDSGGDWTDLAPNVEDYNGRLARLIAAGSGKVIRGILWYGDKSINGLKWGEEFFRRRMGPRSDSDIIPQALRRIESLLIMVKKLTMMCEKVATGILSGVVKVSGFFTSSIVNSRVSSKFFSLLPGEIVLASLDGFNKVFDAVEVAGRNVMTTTSVVTVGLVRDRYGDEAAKVTKEGLDAAGHAIATAWAIFKITKAINPKSAIRPGTLAKAAAQANSHRLKADKYKQSL